MHWFLLLLAGLLEVVWAFGLKYTQGFTRPIPSLLTIGVMGISVYLLSLSMRTLPPASAYAVWVGIGAVGSAAVGIVLCQESVSALKICSLSLIVLGILGLKIAAN